MRGAFALALALFTATRALELVPVNVILWTIVVGLVAEIVVET